MLCHAELCHAVPAMQTAHFKAEAVFLTNDSPGVEWPNEIINDMVSGLPEDVLNKHMGSVYPYFQVGAGADGRQSWCAAPCSAKLLLAMLRHAVQDTQRVPY